MPATNLEDAFSHSRKYSYNRLNATFEIFHDNYDIGIVAYFIREIRSAARCYARVFYVRGHLSPDNERKKEVKVYIFDSLAQYEHYGNQFAFDTNNIGVTRFTIRKDSSILAEVFTFCRDRLVASLRPEIIRSLMHHLKSKMQPVPFEGLAEYIENGGGNATRIELQNALTYIGGEKNLQTLLYLKYENLHRYAGLLLIAFFKSAYPNYLDKYLARLLYNYNVTIDPVPYQEKFIEWINSLCLRTVKDTDAVQVLPNHSVRDGIRDASIRNSERETVGYIPFVELTFYYDTLRLYCAATKDYVDVSSEYSHVKVLTIEDGTDYFGQLCNKQGNVYNDTAEYKLQTKRFFSKQLPATVRAAELERVLSDQSDPDAVVVNELENVLQCELRQLEERLASTTWIHYFEKIDLRKFEPERMKQAQLNEEIFRLLPLDSNNEAHKIHARVRVVDSDGEIVGELDSATAWFDADYNFHYSNSSTNRCMTQSQPVYVTRSEDNELRFVAEFTGKRPIVARVDPVFRLDTRCIDKEVFESLHPKYEAKPTVPLMSVSQYIIAKGKLLDCKDLTQRHCYEGLLKKDGKIVSVLRYVGIYAIEKSLYAHDFKDGRRYKLPEDVRWLKLVRDENDHVYLCPVAYSSVWKADLLLDPLILHTFADGKKTGFVDLDQYKIGTEFRCKANNVAVELYDITSWEFVGYMAADQYSLVSNLFVSFDGTHPAGNSHTVFKEDNFVIGVHDERSYRHRRVYVKDSLP